MALVRDLHRHVDTDVTVSGWVEQLRVHGKVAFVVLRDGTGLVQGVLPKAEVPEAVWELGTSLSQESCITMTGTVRADARAPGGHEMGITDLEVIATSEEYPLQPKEHGVEFLLDHRHLWLRSSLQRAGLRVRSEVEQAIHDFLYDRGFVRIDTPILTGAIGESAGTLFETDYFGQRAFMAQTGDPTGTGRGGSEKPDLRAEFSQEPFLRGTLGMARSQNPNSANSQWFITFEDARHLDRDYTVFGRVVEGMDVVDKIKKAPGSSSSGMVDDPDKIISMRVKADIQ